jgi:hypothetical protein
MRVTQLPQAERNQGFSIIPQNPEQNIIPQTPEQNVNPVQNINSQNSYIVPWQSNNEKPNSASNPNFVSKEKFTDSSNIVPTDNTGTSTNRHITYTETPPIKTFAPTKPFNSTPACMESANTPTKLHGDLFYPDDIAFVFQHVTFIAFTQTTITKINARKRIQILLNSPPSKDIITIPFEVLKHLPCVKRHVDQNYIFTLDIGEVLFYKRQPNPPTPKPRPTPAPTTS